MNAPTVFNIIGLFLITCAVIVHAVCFIMPHYVKGDLTKLGYQVEGQHLNANDTKTLMEIANLQLKINYGLWSLCYSTKQNRNTVCKYWDQDLSLAEWLRAAQVQGILGGVFMISATLGALLHLLFKYRGNNYYRNLPNYICILACISGIIVFIGDAIIISNHKTFPSFLEGQHGLLGVVKAFPVFKDEHHGLPSETTPFPVFKDEHHGLPEETTPFPAYKGAHHGLPDVVKTFSLSGDGHHSLSGVVKTIIGKQFKLDWGLGSDIIASVVVCFGGIAHQLASHYEEKAVVYSVVLD